MPLGASKKSKQTLPRKNKVSHNDRGAHWPVVIWITTIVLVLSLSTMTLAAFAQGISTSYPKSVTGILQALSVLRREVREIGARIIIIESKIIATTSPQNKFAINESTFLEKQFTSDFLTNKNNTSRLEEEPVLAPIKTPAFTQEPEPLPPQNFITAKEFVPPPPPPTNPLKEKYLSICLEQCTSAYNSCVAATNETPVTSNYVGNDPICQSYLKDECNPLCVDWYFYPAPAKPPIPPIESAAQTCLLNCRTQLAGCFKTGGKDQNKLNYCVLVTDKECRAGCTAMNENSKY